MDILGVPLSALDRLGSAATVTLFALMVITDKLVWHKRLDKANERADRWEKAYLDLVVGAKAGVKAAEVAVGVIAALPDPQGERDRAQAGEAT